MSVLTLVRHGQASFFADDYDQLSDIGEQQAIHLGRYWARQKVAIDEVYTGPRLRQRQSAELAGAAYREAGLTWPDPIVLDELDEYDLHGLTHVFAPQLAEQNADFATLREAYHRSEGEDHRLRAFQRMFETLLREWQLCEAVHDRLESWPAFRLRVEGVVRRMQARPGRSRRVVLFTSGGFVSEVTQRALGVSDAATLELNWRIRNGSLTEFVYTSDRFSLDCFNAVPHLDNPALWTYR